LILNLKVLFLFLKLETFLLPLLGLVERTIIWDFCFGLFLHLFNLNFHFLQLTLHTFLFFAGT
jgi:hypothetical protein